MFFPAFAVLLLPALTVLEVRAAGGELDNVPASRGFWSSEVRV